MNKIPYVERDNVSGALTGECAYVWTLFLANEADMADDVMMYSVWKALSEQLAPRPGRPVPCAVHYSELEDAIEEWTNGNSDRV